VCHFGTGGSRSTPSSISQPIRRADRCGRASVKWTRDRWHVEMISTNPLLVSLRFGLWSGKISRIFQNVRRARGASPLYDCRRYCTRFPIQHCTSFRKVALGCPSKGYTLANSWMRPEYSTVHSLLQYMYCTSRSSTIQYSTGH